MIAEIIPEAYDAVGRQVSQPFLRRKGPHPTFPMGRYISQPLTVHCHTIEDVRKFLTGCRAVSDKELFGKEDYWQPPEDFEKRRKGDCEDFSLWTWRQMLALGVDARIVFGRHGRYGIGHAWVMSFEGGKCYLLEPQARMLGLRLPRLSTLSYEPKFSVSWDGKTLRYFAHQKPEEPLAWKQLLPLTSEYLVFWGLFWVKNCYRFPKIAWNLLRYILRRTLRLPRRDPEH